MNLGNLLWRARFDDLLNQVKKRTSWHEPISEIEQEASFVEEMLGRSLSNDVRIAYRATSQLMDNGMVTFIRRGERKYSLDFHEPADKVDAEHKRLALRNILSVRQPKFEDRLEILMDSWAVKEKATPSTEEGYIRLADYLRPEGGPERGR